MATHILRCAVLAALILMSAASAAFAHASLLTAVPANNDLLSAAPADAELTFNEPVGLLSVTLVGPDGHKRDLTSGSSGGQTVTIPLPTDLPEGTEALTWHVISEDGHPVGGTVIFSIGRITGGSAGPATDPGVAVATWVGRVLIYLGLFFGVGTIAFGTVAPLPDVARRIGIGNLAVGAVGALVSIGLEGADGLGLTLAGLADPKAWTTGWATTFGLSVAAFFVAFGLAWLSTASRGRLSRMTALLALAATGLSLTFSGHAAAAEPQWVTRPAVFVHLTAICFWVGALVPLAILLTVGGDRAQRALGRFSTIIPWAIAPLLASGLALAVIQLGPPGQAWLVPYGALLCAKLALLAILFGLAIWNRWRLTRPALAGVRTARRRLGRSVRAEIVLVLLALGVVAGWRFTPPPRAVAAALSVPAEVHIMDGGLMADVTVLPGRVGPVGIGIYLMDADLNPVSALSVKVELRQPSAGIGPMAADATPAADGLWHAGGLVLPASGTWVVTVDVRTGKFEMQTMAGPIEIQ